MQPIIDRRGWPEMSHLRIVRGNTHAQQLSSGERQIVLTIGSSFTIAMAGCYHRQMCFFMVCPGK